MYLHRSRGSASAGFVAPESITLGANQGNLRAEPLHFGRFLAERRQQERK